MSKVLVTGWFSFEHMGASAGDLIARDLACRWLERAGLSYDIATVPPFTDGINWRDADPRAYARVLFVCGPFGNGEPLLEFLERFAGKLVGLNLTMLQSLAEWNPFQFLIERDSSRATNPDIVFGAHPPPRVPLVGLAQIDAQPEYRKRDLHQEADEALRRLIASREMAVVPIDTRLDQNRTGLRTPAEVESLIARMDVVLTTRLHGMVLALKNGVPVVAIDSVAGGAKVRRQADAIGWPIVFNIDRLTDADLQRAFNYSLTPDARGEAVCCRDQAAAAVERLGDQLVAWLSGEGRA
jgi:hypothetical protein